MIKNMSWIFLVIPRQKEQMKTINKQFGGTIFLKGLTDGNSVLKLSFIGRMKEK